VSYATKLVPAFIAAAIAQACLAAEISEASLRAADAEQMRIIVEGDAVAQNAFMHENYILNAPTHRVLRKAVLVEMLSKGQMASERFERVIEGVAITGNIGIVMGARPYNRARVATSARRSAALR
jgi:ABC-type enterobactin transport system permease subunit